MPGALEALEPEFEFLAGGVGGITGAGADVTGETLAPAELLDDDDAGLDAGPTGEVPIAGLVLPGFLAELLAPADEPASLVP